MVQKSIKKNFIYNLIFTSLNMIFPLITAPYVSTVLGADNIGKVNYATSIINWFILFSTFGIPRYGIREIAKNRTDKKKLSNIFWNLISIQTILSIVSIVCYIIMVFNLSKFSNNLPLYSLMIIQIILNIFSIDWFFQGIEEYGYITVRNVIFKVISIVLIFLMIQNHEDYLMYALVNILGLSFNNILNFLHSRKYIEYSMEKFMPLHYLSELRIYFLTTLVIALYTQLDQTLLGSISEKELAYYLRSKTFLGIGTGVVNSIITVLIPRMAYLADKNYEEYKIRLEQSINYIYLLAFPCVTGLFLLADQVMVLFGGSEFIPAGISLKIICFQVLITSIGGWQVQQILIPHKRERIALKLQIFSAIFSIILNLILIPKFTFIGAAITWTLTELCLLIIESIYIVVRIKEIKIPYVNKSMIKYLISAIIMSLMIIWIQSMKLSIPIIIGLSLMIGPIIYFGLIILMRDDIVYLILKQSLKRLRSLDIDTIKLLKSKSRSIFWTQKS